MLKIGNRIISKDTPPLVIVELGINHNGNINVAKKLVNSAKKAGAEVIKHQTHIAPMEMSSEAKKIIPVHAKESIYKIIDKCSISSTQEILLKKHVLKNKMIFLSTPFSREAALRLYKLGVPAFKIGSGECNNYPLIEYICKFKKPIILSTGMNDIPSIKKAVKIIEKHKINYALLHTTNLYPTPYNLIRLNSIDQLKKEFPKAIVGLSDHTDDNYTSFAAVAKGAKIIEKHYVDRYSRKGVDVAASINFKKLKELIYGSKKIFEALSGNKKPPKEEKETMKFAFASIVAIKDIKKNERLSLKNIWVKRPGTGDYLAKDLKKLLGKKTKRSIIKDTQVKRRDLYGNA